MNKPFEQARDCPRPAVSAVIFRGSKILLVKRGKGGFRGLWSLPGGRVEIGETVRDAIVREVREETSIFFELGPIVDVHDVILSDDAGAVREHFVLCVFSGRWLAGEPVARSDATRASFVRVCDLREDDLTPELLRFVAAAQQIAP
ncbi:MAG: NUDIX hydrolase [Hyphomicrobiaceae bacterium]